MNVLAEMLIVKVMALLATGVPACEGRETDTQERSHALHVMWGLGEDSWHVYGGNCILICMISTRHGCSPYSYGNTNNITTILVHMNVLT